ncbi:MAG: thiamine pyrophosphate-binding protein, partial [Desulfobacterales bacterium]|nr:thiamine pyrophosphate-binding protein [Desulfobacterales bacterium]
TIQYISCRHEQVAASMADAHGRLTGRPGVCLVHSGPGALNALIGLANAAKDCSPVIAITGAVKARVAGSNGILEADHATIFSPVCKRIFRIDRANQAQDVVFEAYQTAMSFPRGPVLIEFPEDAAAAISNQPFVESEVDVPAPPRAEDGVVEEILAAVDQAERPVVLAGAGIAYSGSQERLKKLVETLNLPVVTTGNGRGTLSETHGLCLGRCGFGGGNTVADEALKKADLLLALGCTISDLTSYEYTFPIEADIYAVNLDSDNDAKKIEFKKVVTAEVGGFLSALVEKLPRSEPKRRDEWLAAFEAPRKAWNDMLQLACDGEKTPLSPGFICKTLDGLLPEDTIIAVGAGTHVLYPMAYMPVKRPLTYLSAVNFGAMGFGFPAALAAKLERPSSTVVNITGDGDFMMTIQDLETAVREKISVKVLIINDNAYRVLYLRQKFLFNGRFLGTRHGNPDFVRLAESFGAKGLRIERPEEVKPGLEQMLEHDGPVVLEAVVDPDDMAPTNLEAVFTMG